MTCKGGGGCVVPLMNKPRDLNGESDEWETETVRLENVCRFRRGDGKG